MRGKPIDDQAVCFHCGLIPACAGKTKTHLILPKQLQAHPRVCGENKRSEFSPAKASGSSPRVRGKHSGRERAEESGGLIPACAGKTGDGRTITGLAVAHPRVCGENSDGAITALSIGGSSPRVRGKRSAMRDRCRIRGLIPACAGKTASVSVESACVEAHPRVCGENIAFSPSTKSHTGSSPRVRGKLDQG